MLKTYFGKRGSGKTTAIRAEIPELKKPIVILDVLGNFDPEVEPNEATWIGVTSASEAIEEMVRHAKEPKKHPGVIIIQSANMSHDVDYISSALWKLRGGTIVLDEIDAVSIPEAPCFDELIRYGRNRGIDVVTGCRRPAEISKNITAGADIILCFTTHEPRDIDYFSQKLGDEYAQALPKLEPFHGIYIDYANRVSGEFKSENDGKITRLTENPIQ